MKSKVILFCISLLIAFNAYAAGGSRNIKINKVMVNVNAGNPDRGYIWFSDQNNSGYLFLTNEIDLRTGGAKSFLASLLSAKANSTCVNVYFGDTNYPQFLFAIETTDQCP